MKLQPLHKFKCVHGIKTLIGKILVHCTFKLILFFIFILTEHIKNTKKLQATIFFFETLKVSLKYFVFGNIPQPFLVCYDHCCIFLGNPTSLYLCWLNTYKLINICLQNMKHHQLFTLKVNCIYKSIKYSWF